MSGLVRWSDRAAEVDPELREVMRYARRQGPDEAQLAALTERVLAQLPDAANAPATSSAGLRFPVALGIKAGAVTLCASICGLALWTLSRIDRDHGQASSGAPALELPAPTRPAASARPAVETAMDAPPADGDSAQVDGLRAASATTASAGPEAEVAVRRAARARRSGDAEPVRARRASSASAADELSLLHEARRLLHEHPAAALALAREHERQYPNSTFCEEREALLVEALFRAGQDAQGTARLQRFLARYPHSAYVARVRKWALGDL